MDYNRNYVNVSMSAESFASVNMPLSAVSIFLNMFFIFCMVFPPRGAEKLKNPLTILMGSLIACHTIISLCSCLVVLNEFGLFRSANVSDSYDKSDLILSILMYTMMTSATSCHCKNMFYFCQIVPPQCSIFIWFKRNIRAVIYSVLVANAIFYVFGLTVDVTNAVTQVKLYNAYNISVEMEELMSNAVFLNGQIRLVDFWARLVFFWLSLSVMLASSVATVLYLWKHMKNMEESGLSCFRLQRQIKVIIIGIIAQALVHVLCSDGILIDEIMARYTSRNFDLNGFILYTIISFYSLGTTVNMGLSHSLFRHGAVHVFARLSGSYFIGLIK